MAENIPTQLQTPGATGAVTEPTVEQPEVEFTPEQQAKIDAIIKDRLARATKNTLSKEEIKSLRDKAAKADTLEQEKLTAQQKLEAKLQVLEAEKTAKDKEITERDRRELKRSGIEKLIADKKVTLPEGWTVSDAMKHADLSEDGELDSAELLRLCPVKKGLGGGTQTGHSTETGPTFQEKYNSLMKANRIQEAVALKNAYLKGLHPEMWNK